MSVARKRVLFLCTHNSARSQMAEGLLRSIGHVRDAMRERIGRELLPKA